MTIGAEPRIVALDAMEGLKPSGEFSIEAADVILTRRSSMDAAIIARAEQCYLIIILGAGAGPDAPRIDLEAARAAGIYVTSIPDYDTDAYAAETIQLLEDALAASGRSTDFRELRLGIIGLGQVGRAVAAIAGKRGALLWAYDPFCPPNPFDVLNVQPAPLEELLGMVHAVTLHAPLGPATRHLINAGNLPWFQSQTGLINTAAPELVDLDALADALQRNRPAVAALNMDLATLVPASHPLLACKNLIQQAAKAGRGEQAESNLVRRAQSIIDEALRGQRPKHLLIDPPCPRHALWHVGGAAAQM